MNAQRVALKRGAREITVADLQAAVDAGSELLLGYGCRLLQYSEDAGRFLQHAVHCAGGLNATMIDQLRTVLAARAAAGSDADLNLMPCSLEMWLTGLGRRPLVLPVLASYNLYGARPSAEKRMSDNRGEDST